MDGIASSLGFFIDQGSGLGVGGVGIGDKLRPFI